MTITHGGNVFALARMLGCEPGEILDFSASINPLGMADGVREAMVNALDRVVHYPEQQSTALNAALAEEWGVPLEYILTGNGATDLIHFVGRCLPAPPAPVTLLVPTFSEFHRAYPRAKLVRRWEELSGFGVVTRPNNPFGTILPIEAVESKLRDGHQLLVDESFLEFTEAASALSLVVRYENLLVLRSLTKLHALPGLRIGALVGQSVPGMMPYREPWQVNVLAEAAALVAIRTTGHHQRTRDFVNAERCWLADQLAQVPGLRPLPGTANYLLVLTAQDPAPLVAWLAARRLLVRDCTHIPGVDAPSIRVAVRLRPDHERLLNLLKEFLCATV